MGPEAAQKRAEQLQLLEQLIEQRRSGSALVTASSPAAGGGDSYYAPAATAPSTAALLLSADRPGGPVDLSDLGTRLRQQPRHASVG